MLTEKRDNVGTMKYIEEYETVKFILNYMNLNFEPQELVGIYGRAACVESYTMLGKKERDKLCPKVGLDLSLSSIGRSRYTILHQTGLR